MLQLTNSLDLLDVGSGVYGTGVLATNLVAKCTCMDTNAVLALFQAKQQGALRQTAVRQAIGTNPQRKARADAEKLGESR